MELLVDEGIDQYAFRNTTAEPELLQSLAERTFRETQDPGMLTVRDGVQLVRKR
jgi:hypothetical protein